METKYDGLILSDLKYEPPMSLDMQALYKKFARRVMWIDDNVVPGSFQMNVSWYCSAPERDPIFPEHAHASAELIGFFGSDPEDPYNLHGEIGIEIDGELHRFTRSSLIFIPPNLPHALHIYRIDRPVFHFSAVTEAHYNNSAYGE